MSRPRNISAYISPETSFDSRPGNSLAMPPRSSLRQRTATPARSTRAATATLQDTPGARKSARAISRQPVTIHDVVTNPALPEIQTQQSYAYGSSKTPALPEQLTARDMSMKAVANRLNVAADEAERNFEAHAAEVRGTTPESQVSARETRAQRRASKEPPLRSPPAATPDDVRKQHRTAAWISSSQLDDIREEDSRHQSLDRRPETPHQDREDSLPSSMPTGSFNYSYNYERGEREPVLPHSQNDRMLHPLPRTLPPQQAQRQSQLRQPQHLQTHKTALHTRVINSIRQASFVTMEYINRLATATWYWIIRMIQTLQKCLLDLPDSPAVSALFKTLFVFTILTLCGMTFCAAFVRTCNSSSTSIVSQYLQSLCGRCTSSSSLDLPNWNLSDTNSHDMHQLGHALKQTLNQISHIEQRLNSRIDSSHASLSSDASTLRAQQDLLETQMHRLAHSQPSLESLSLSNDVPSPLMPKINFFSRQNGAKIIPHLTSPTRAERHWFVVEVGMRMFGVRRHLSSPPSRVLEAWLDEGDRWCAAEVPNHLGRSQPKGNPVQAEDQQDSIRLAIQTGQQIYPTELVVEHFPGSGSLEPGAAPRDIELWADFSDLSYDEWQKLHIQDLITESPAQNFLSASMFDERTRSWARIGTATYAISASSSSSLSSSQQETYEINADERFNGRRKTIDTTQSHVQRFNLNINQNGLLHYSDRFLIRVRNNHGASHTCLYRVRLHGLPLDHVEK